MTVTEIETAIKEVINRGGDLYLGLFELVNKMAQDGASKDTVYKALLELSRDMDESPQDDVYLILDRIGGYCVEAERINFKS